MQRSKLETHADILKVLCHGPLKLTQIMHKANINFGVLKQYLDFLTQRNLSEQQTLHAKKVVCVITEKGRTVLKYFMELNKALPINAPAKGMHTQEVI